MQASQGGTGEAVRLCLRPLRNIAPGFQVDAARGFDPCLSEGVKCEMLRCGRCGAALSVHCENLDLFNSVGWRMEIRGRLWVHSSATIRVE